MNANSFVLRQSAQCQTGSVLLLILVLLVVGSLVGLSIAQTSITDERISGNYRAVVQADMAAQAGALKTLRVLRDSAQGQRKSIGELFEYVKAKDEDYFLKIDEIKGLTGAALWSVLAARMPPESGADGQTEYVYGFYKEDDDTIIMVVQARHIGALSESGDDPTYTYSQPVFITIGSLGDGGGGGGGGNSPVAPSLTYKDIFPSVVAACESVVVGGGSVIAYTDSRNGPWTGSAPATNEVVLKALTNKSPNVRLKGNERIYGSIQAIGWVELQGSSQVYGNIQSNGNILLNGGGAKVFLNTISASDVRFGSSARVDGNVIAQNSIVFGNWSATVGGFLRAGGSIVSNTSRPNYCDHASGSCTANDSSLSVDLLPAITESACDFPVFGGETLKDQVNDLKGKIASGGVLNLNDWNSGLNGLFQSNGLSVYRGDGNVSRNLDPVSHNFLSVQSGFYRFDNLTVGSNGSLKVGKDAGNIVVMVDGNLTFGGGGDGLVIGENSSLTFIVGGKTQIGSVVKMLDGNGNPLVSAVTSDGRPILTILSYYDVYSGAYDDAWDYKQNVAVNFDGGSRVAASVYAPYGNVYVGSGGWLYGAVMGKSVLVSGDGRVIFDKAIMDASIGGGSGGNDNGSGGGGSKAITNWR